MAPGIGLDFMPCTERSWEDLSGELCDLTGGGEEDGLYRSKSRGREAS